MKKIIFVLGRGFGSRVCFSRYTFVAARCQAVARRSSTIAFTYKGDIYKVGG